MLLASWWHSPASAPPTPAQSASASPHKPETRGNATGGKEFKVQPKCVFFVLKHSSSCQAKLSLISTYLTNCSFILVQIVSELLQLQLSLPQLVLQVPHHPFISLHRARGASTGPAVRKGLSSPAYRPRTCTLTRRWAPAVWVGVSVCTDWWSTLHGLQVASRGLCWGQAVASTAVRRQAGEGVAARVRQRAGLAAASTAITSPTVRAAFLRTRRRYIPVCGAKQVQIVLAFWCVGTMARGEVLHGGTALGNDRFEGSWPQHCFLHVLDEKTEDRTNSERQASKDCQQVYLNSSAWKLTSLMSGLLMLWNFNSKLKIIVRYC